MSLKPRDGRPGRVAREAWVQDGLVPLLDLPAAPVEHPRACDEIERVKRAVAAACWPGQVLPAARVTSSVVYPVVTLLAAAVDRLAAGAGPELDGRTLELWEDWPGELGNLPPQTALRVVGFVTIAGSAEALRRVRRMRGMGAGMVVAQRVTQWQAWEADLASVWLVRDDGQRSEVLVPGRTGPVHTAYRTPGTRLVEERLFAHAIRCGAVTSPQSRA